MQRPVKWLIRLLALAFSASIVAAIIGVVAAVIARDRLVSEGDESSDDVELVGIFDQAQLVSRAERFRGGRVVAWFGAAQLDLRGATLDPAGASLVARSAWGGIDITVPEGWRVEMHGLAVFGATPDMTAVEGLADDAPVLEVRAFAVFGAVTVTARPADQPNAEPVPA